MGSISASHAKSSTQPATDIFMPEALRSRTASFKLPAPESVGEA
jgi:hypothetical protein